MLRDAILRSADASDIIGVRALLVHAITDKARATDPLRLLLLIKDARVIVGR